MILGFPTSYSPDNGVCRGSALSDHDPPRQPSRRHRRRAIRIDEICRFLFPLLFTIFNGFYWYYYREEEVA